MRSGGRRTGEAGISLVEVLLAVAILAVSAAALLGAVSTIAITSRGHTEQSKAEAVLVSAVEHLRDPSVAYVPCATTSTAPYLAAARSASVPAAWTPATAIAITEVRYWNGDQFVPGIGNCLDGGPIGNLLQLVTIQVASPDGHTFESVSVVKEAR